MNKEKLNKTLEYVGLDLEQAKELYSKIKTEETNEITKIGMKKTYDDVINVRDIIQIYENGMMGNFIKLFMTLVVDRKEMDKTIEQQILDKLNEAIAIVEADSKEMKRKIKEDK